MERRLAELNEGDKGKITRLEGGGRFTSQMRLLGLKEGSEIKVIVHQPLGGPVVVKTGNTTLTVGRGKAQKIIVEK